MSGQERDRWDHRYATGDYQPRLQHSPLVEEAVDHLDGGRALVLAGMPFPAAQGFEVEAVDVTAVAIEMAETERKRRGLKVIWRVVSIEDLEYAEAKYQLITMIRYLNRDMWPSVRNALAPDGWLVMEQHLKTRLEVAGPSNESRVSPGELLASFGDLRVIKYLEDHSRSLLRQVVCMQISVTRQHACHPGWWFECGRG